MLLINGSLLNKMGVLANINYDGKVYPNIVEIENDDFCIGDLSNDRLEKIWHGEKYNKAKINSNLK